jgi:hypothetical protein
LPAAGVGTDPAVFCFSINISYYPILNVVLLRMIIFI